MSFDEYMFKASGQIMRMFHKFDYHVPIFSLLQNVAQAVTQPLAGKCKKKSNHSPIDNHTISITQVYFKNISPLRKKPESKQLIFGTDEQNVENSWKIYKQEFKETPKIGDIIEVHYTVPYEKDNPRTQTT